MSKINRTDDFLRQVRDLLGPDACVGINSTIGMLAAFPTSDFNQRPYVIAGTEEALIQAIREKQAAPNRGTTDELRRILRNEPFRS